MKRKTALLTALMGSLLLSTAALADTKEVQVHNLANFTASAGAPVEFFRLVGPTIDSWTAVGTEHVVIYTRPLTAYLLTLDGTCSGLDFTSSISVDSSMRTVRRNLSLVHVLSPGNGGNSCKITAIQPVDVMKYKTLNKASPD